MAVRFKLFLILNTIFSTTLGVDLSQFENCVVHIKRFGDDIDSIKLTEKVIHLNQNTVQKWTIFDSNNTRKIESSLSVYEICTINLIIQVTDDIVQLHYFLHDNSYIHLTNDQSIYVIIAPKLPGGLTNLFYKISSRIFWVVTSDHKDEWIFLCPYCKQS